MEGSSRNLKRGIYALVILIVIVGLIIVFIVTGPPRSPEVPTTQQSQPFGEEELGSGITVTFFNSSYKVVYSKPHGWFLTGQEADILLSGIDFNNAGGPLLFNHPAGIATDGQHLLLADRNNNRVLIWNELPTGNEEPDIVLGQKDFISNNPGTGPGELNWPVSVATDGEHVLVADTENDRILIWNSFPTRSGEEADVILQGSEELGIDARGNILWPWAVWTDGERVLVASTGSSQVLIWNHFPTRDNQPPEIILKLDDFGTPRSIASDGEHLVIGDHNAFGNQRGTFFWKSFPTDDDQKYDFFIGDPGRIAGGQQASPSGAMPGQVLWSDFTPDGKLICLGVQIYIWNSFPEDENDPPDYIIGSTSPAEPGYRYEGGDGSGVAVAGETIFLTLGNGNKVVGFHSMPTRQEQRPDFAIGAPDVDTNTLETYFFITNPVPISDGEHLFVISDYDRKLYVWRALPDESGAKPDLVYTLPEPVWDGVARGGKLILVGGSTLYLWEELPLNGEEPRIISSIGKVRFQGLSGVALDDRYLYLSDTVANKIYIWEGIPSGNEDPKFELDVDHPGRLSSDGSYLVMIDTFGHSVKVFKVDMLGSNPEPFIVDKPGGRDRGMRYNGFNLPMDALVYKGSLFVADTGFNRVVVWRNIEDAIAGKPADVILGEKDLMDTRPEIGKDKLFWPAALEFDGSFLWIGEFKFSGRLLRFSVRG